MYLENSVLEGDCHAQKRDFALKYFKPKCNAVLFLPELFPWLSHYLSIFYCVSVLHSFVTDSSSFFFSLALPTIFIFIKSPVKIKLLVTLHVSIQQHSATVTQCLKMDPDIFNLDFDQVKDVWVKSWLVFWGQRVVSTVQSLNLQLQVASLQVVFCSSQQ